jgi:hypothetical protein
MGNRFGLPTAGTVNNLITPHSSDFLFFHNTLIIKNLSSEKSQPDSENALYISQNLALLRAVLS